MRQRKTCQLFLRYKVPSQLTATRQARARNDVPHTVGSSPACRRREALPTRPPSTRDAMLRFGRRLLLLCVCVVPIASLFYEDSRRGSFSRRLLHSLRIRPVGIICEVCEHLSFCPVASGPAGRSLLLPRSFRARGSTSSPDACYVFRKNLAFYLSG